MEFGGTEGSDGDWNRTPNQPRGEKSQKSAAERRQRMRAALRRQAEAQGEVVGLGKEEIASIEKSYRQAENAIKIDAYGNQNGGRRRRKLPKFETKNDSNSDLSDNPRGVQKGR